MTRHPSTHRARCTLEMLARAVDSKSPCPPQRAIARMLSSTQEANHAVAELVREGFVQFQRHPTNGRRRVFVFAQPNMRAGWSDWGKASGGHRKACNRMPANAITPHTLSAADEAALAAQATYDQVREAATA